MNVVVVYNLSAGSAPLDMTDLYELCQKYDIRVEKFIRLDKNLRHNLAPYIKKSMTIAAVGGDGTLSAVAACVAGTKSIFIPLPGGTLNHFAKDVGVAENIEIAIKNASRRHEVMVDIATVNKKVFINNASLGLYPTSLRLRSRLEKYIGKWPAACVSALRTFAWFRVYKVTIDGETFRTPFVFVGNNKYTLNKLGIPERKTLDSGELSIFIARTPSRFELLKIVGLTLLGKAKLLQNFDIRHGKEIVIKTHRHVHVACDGETVRLQAPLHFKIRPRSLCMYI
jgi:diacylglycerol kinase family enzyme